MDIIAQRGKSTFLAVDKITEDKNPPAKLINLKQGISTEVTVQQALKFGYWDEPGEISPKIKKEIQRLFDATN